MAASVLRYQQHCEALTLKESLRRLPGMAAASSALSSALRQQARGCLRRNNSCGDMSGKVEQQAGGHRRSASHTSVYPVSAQALAPAKRLRRDKTRSFDCALLSGAWADDCASASGSCCAASLAGSESGHVSDASSEVSSASSEYVIDPALEAMLSSQFEAAGFPMEACKQPSLEQPGDEPRRRKKKSKHHRRSKSILFRSDESGAAEEELAANLDMAFDEFDFSRRASDSESFESVLARTISKKDGPGLGLPIILE